MKESILYLFFASLVYAPYLISRIILTRRYNKVVHIYHALFYLVSIILFFIAIQYGIAKPNYFTDRLIAVVFIFLPYIVIDSILFYRFAKNKLMLEREEIIIKIYSLISISVIILFLEVIIGIILLINIASHF